jgi:hypothetical protein
MTLADHWNDGDYLGVGNHDPVEVTGFKTNRCDSGSMAVNFAVANNDGESKAGFVIKGKGIGRLASFAKACGMTRDEAAEYDPESKHSHQQLVGRKVGVHVKKDGKYHEVDDWWPCGEAPEEPREPRVQHPNADSGPSIGDDIPF